MKTAFFAGSFVLLALVAFPAFGQSDDEIAAKAAEQAGRLRDALTQYTAALQKVPDSSADDQRLREAIINLAKRLSPRPAIPEEAQRRMIRGRVATKAASDEQGFLRAAEEFRQAVKAAPWLQEGYFNLAVVLDKAGRYSEAVRNLKLYLLAVANPADAKQARDLMFEIEYRQEDAQRAKAVAEQKAQAEAEMKPGKGQDLNGTWRRSEEKGWKLPQPDGEYVVSIIGTSIEIYNKQFARSDLYQGTVHGSLVKGVVVNRGWTGSPNGEFVAEISEDRRRIKILGTIGEPKVDNNGRVMRGVWDFKGVDITLIR